MMDDEARRHATEGMATVEAVVARYNLDDDIASDLYLHLCRIACTPQYQALPDDFHRRKYLHRSLKYMAFKKLRDAKTRKRIEGYASPHHQDKTVADTIIRRDEGLAAAAEWAEYQADWQPGNFSSKQSQINKLRRERKYGKQERGQRSRVLRLTSTESSHR